MEQDLLKLKNDASSMIIAAEDEEELTAIKLDFLGKNGKLTLLLKEIKNVPEERRAEDHRVRAERDALGMRELLAGPHFHVMHHGHVQEESDELLANFSKKFDQKGRAVNALERIKLK